MGHDKNFPCTVTAFNIFCEDYETLFLEWYEYLYIINLIPEDPTSTLCRWESIWARSLKSRPGCLFEVPKLMQISRDVFESARRFVIKKSSSRLPSTAKYRFASLTMIIYFSILFLWLICFMYQFRGLETVLRILEISLYSGTSQNMFYQLYLNRTKPV